MTRKKVVIHLAICHPIITRAKTIKILLLNLIIQTANNAIKETMASLYLFLKKIFFLSLFLDVEPAPEPVPVAPKPTRSRGKAPVTTRTSSRHSSKVKCAAILVVYHVSKYNKAARNS